MSGALAGRSILVTRPAGQAERLAERIRAAGGEALIFPALEIVPPADRSALDTTIDRLDRFQIAVFISPTAVERGHAAVILRRKWPAATRLAAVGEGTASALRALGFTDVIAPPGRGDSDALAALPEFSRVRGLSIVIFRGEGGRESLRGVLQERGATVEYAECYRRVRPSASAAGLISRWAAGGVHAVSVTSSEGLENLAGMLGEAGMAYLRAAPVFVPHPRIAEAARRLGIETALLVDQGDPALVDALGSFFAAKVRM